MTIKEDQLLDAAHNFASVLGLSDFKTDASMTPGLNVIRVTLFHEVEVPQSEFRAPEAAINYLCKQLEPLRDKILDSDLVRHRIAEDKKRIAEQAKLISDLQIENRKLQRYQHHHDLEMELRHGKRAP